MDLPDPKALKKLAAACRKAGIKTYKGNGFEITLSDDAPPVRPYKAAKSKAVLQTGGSEEVQTDDLTEDQLLFWSAASADPDKEQAEQ